MSKAGCAGRAPSSSARRKKVRSFVLRLRSPLRLRCAALRVTAVRVHSCWSPRMTGKRLRPLGTHRDLDNARIAYPATTRYRATAASPSVNCVILSGDRSPRSQSKDLTLNLPPSFERWRVERFPLYAPLAFLGAGDSISRGRTPALPSRGLLRDWLVPLPADASRPLPGFRQIWVPVSGRVRSNPPPARAAAE